jgi:hypothetical protein
MTRAALVLGVYSVEAGIEQSRLPTAGWRFQIKGCNYRRAIIGEQSMTSCNADVSVLIPPCKPDTFRLADHPGDIANVHQDFHRRRF